MTHASVVDHQGSPWAHGWHEQGASETLLTIMIGLCLRCCWWQYCDVYAMSTENLHSNSASLELECWSRCHQHRWTSDYC